MLLTVIIPAHKAAEHVFRALDSAAAIDFPTEILLVENGSVELEGLEWPKDSIHHYRYLNSGAADLSRARNHGLAHAGGEFVFFLDADDEVLSAEFSEAVRSLVALRGDLLMFPSRDLGRSSRRARAASRTVVRRFPSGARLAEWCLVRVSFTANAGVRVVRRALLIRHFSGFREGAFHEDHYYAFVVHAVAGVSLHVNRPLHLRHRSSTSITATISQRESKRGYEKALADIEAISPVLAAPASAEHRAAAVMLARFQIAYLKVSRWGQPGGAFLSEMKLLRARLVFALRWSAAVVLGATNSGASIYSARELPNARGYGSSAQD